MTKYLNNKPTNYPRCGKPDTTKKYIGHCVYSVPCLCRLPNYRLIEVPKVKISDQLDLGI